MEDFDRMTPEGVLKKYKELYLAFNEKKEVLDNLVMEFQNRISGLRTELTNLEVDLKSFEMYNMPRVFVSEVEDKARGKKYLRGVVRYYVPGSSRQKSTTIHLGKLSDYPMGLEDVRLKEMSEFKAIEFIQRMKGRKEEK
jgi:hypothetical protein